MLFPRSHGKIKLIINLFPLMFSDFNIIGIIAAVVADMVIGTLWYSPVLFGPMWMQLTGITKEDLMAGGRKAMGFAVVNSLVMASVLAFFIDALNITSVDRALEFAFMVWLGFVVTTNATKVIYEKQSFHVYALAVSYQLISLLVMSIILVNL